MSAPWWPPCPSVSTLTTEDTGCHGWEAGGPECSAHHLLVKVFLKGLVCRAQCGMASCPGPCPLHLLQGRIHVPLPHPMCCAHAPTSLLLPGAPAPGTGFTPRSLGCGWLLVSSVATRAAALPFHSLSPRLLRLLFLLRVSQTPTSCRSALHQCLRVSQG